MIPSPDGLITARATNAIPAVITIPLHIFIGFQLIWSNDTDHRPPPETNTGCESNVQEFRSIETEKRGGGSSPPTC
jgi:hypothetical protein